MKQLAIFIAILFIAGCGSSKKIAEQIEQKPSWTENRPVETAYYTGIGIAKKWGSAANYQSDAREKALSDMAGQINTQIASTSVLHQVENRQGVSEMLANQIKASSKEFLEGYEMVDDWQDETTYFIYYRLSKAKFAELKETRRQNALANALARYTDAQLQANNQQTASALALYASVLETLKDYLGDSNLAETTQGTTDLAIQSLKSIKQTINNLSVSALTDEIKGTAGQLIPETRLMFTVNSAQGQPQANIPVAFAYSGGYLRKDNALTDINGTVATSIHQVNPAQSTQTLCARVDVTNLARQMSRELLVRKLIEETSGNSACISIKL